MEALTGARISEPTAREDDHRDLTPLPRARSGGNPAVMEVKL